MIIAIIIMCLTSVIVSRRSFVNRGGNSEKKYNKQSVSRFVRGFFFFFFVVLYLFRKRNGEKTTSQTPRDVPDDVRH